MGLLGLASVAVIKVLAHTALVADAGDWLHTTAIAGDFIVDLGCLVGGLLAQVVNHESLEGLGGIGLHLLLDNLNQVLVELVLEGAGSIALSARDSLLVDLGAVALEADHTLIVRDLLLFVLRADNLAVNLLGDPLCLELAALALGLDEAIARDFLHFLEDLGSDVLGVNDCIELLFIGLDLRVAAEVLLIDGIGACLSVILGRAGVKVFITTNRNTVGGV